MSESSFSARLRKEMSNFGFRCYRVESGTTSPGIPDIMFVGKQGATRVEGWIETKEVEKRPRKVPFRPAQAGWLHTYHVEGGYALTIVKVRDTNEVLIIPARESYQAERDLSRCVFKIFAMLPGASWWPICRAILLKEVV